MSDDKGQLTAWERWELADFDTPKAAAKPADKAKAPVEPEVKLPTAEEIERIYQEAQEQGRSQGFEEGRKAGYEEGQAKARDEAARLARLGERFAGSLSQFDAAVADELLALAVEFARQVVRQEIHAHPESLLTVIREALEQIPHQHATVRLNPEDASLARSYLGDQLAHFGHRILEDAALVRGDCIVESGNSHVDATVATRWRRVLDGLGMDAAWQPKDEA
ncbi:MAG: flagellar assembly protein FliH [Ignavibacteria bacterium]